jgi:alpha-mannosidase
MPIESTGSTMSARISFALLFLPILLTAQTAVDRLTGQLDSLSRISCDGWKYSTDFSIDPAKSVVSDAGWKDVKLNQVLTGDSCWMRREIVLPAAMLGKPTAGAITFEVTVDDYGYLFVDGAARGRFNWNGEFDLTNNARPGQKFTILIKVINTGGPMRIMRARVSSSVSRDLARRIDDFAFSMRVGQKLLSFDTYQSNARVKVDPFIDRSKADRAEKQQLNSLLQKTADQVNIDALREGDAEEFSESLDDARTNLKPVAAYAKRFTLFFDANAHIDAAWLWREKETIEVCRRTFSSVMNMMNARPDFTYTQSSAAYYDWMERYEPALFGQIRDRIREGRWEVIGGMWVEPDCNLPSGESWMRQMLYAKSYFRDKFGVDVTTGWNPDSFGYNWNMPQFYRHAGIDAFITQKIGWNESNVFPHRVFWWQAPDGSRILSYFPFDYVNEVSDPYRMVDWLRQFEANTGFTKMLVLFGVGDHGGGPSLEMLQRIDRLATLDIFPSIEHGTSAKYLGWLRQQDLAQIPVWNDELYLEYHQGTFTTQAHMKAANRANEALLTAAEKFSCIASEAGYPYQAKLLRDAWIKVLFNQFHDILPGSSIHEVYVDAAETNKEATKEARHVLRAALGNIAEKLNTSKLAKGAPLVVFNPLAWDRTDIVEYALPDFDTASYSVYDAEGRSVPSQIIGTGSHGRSVIFKADAVPSIGYRSYQLVREEEPAAAPAIPQRNSIENASFVVSLDPVNGWLSSIFDKRHNRELLAGPGNELQILEDKPTAWDAWNIGLTGVIFPSVFRGAEIVEQGPVRTVLRLRRDYLKPGVKKEFPTEDFPSSFFTQDVILYNGIGRIHFKTDVDWWEEKTMLKVAFPLALKDTLATYEIPYGHIARSTQMRDSWEQAKVEVPAQRWADLSSSSNGVSLLNTSKYGYDIKGNIMRLSLLRSPKWPDPMADRGRHSIEYALYPHEGNWAEANTVARGYEMNEPLQAVATGIHDGSLGPEGTFVSVDPPNLILTTIKRAETGNAWIVQLYESAGRDTDAMLLTTAAPEKVMLSDAMEGDGKPMPFEKNVLRFSVKKNSIVTLKLQF